MQKILKASPDHLTTKALEDGSVYIEGWANKAVVDRGKDLISSKAWDLGNYKKNSIILFNHDHTKPIGKMISVDVKDEGLFVKGRISNSKDPEISRVRDLVKEGILNSLSVGIMVKDEDMKDGVNHIKSVELHEVSVVAVPMNQDSQFTVTAKSMQAPLLTVLKQISDELGQKDISKAYDLLAKSKDSLATVEDVAKSIAEKTSCSEIEAHGFLRGLFETPKLIEKWLKGKAMDEEMKPEETPKEEKPKDEMKAEETPKVDVYAIRVPKEAFASMEELASWAESSGWKYDNIEEEESSFLLVQRPMEDFVGEMREADMGDGVIGLVGDLKPEMDSEEEKPEEEVTVEIEMGAESKDIVSQFEQETQTAIAGGEGNPPSWVADEALWEKAKRASEAALGEVSYAFVVWWYMDQGGSKKGLAEKQALLDDVPAQTQPVAGMTADQIEVNPSLDQAKQTNVLLANAVSLLQQLNEKFDKMPQETAPMMSQEPVAVMSSEEQKAEEEVAKKLKDFMIKTEERLKVLGL